MDAEKDHQAEKPTYVPIGETIYPIVHYMHENLQAELACVNPQTGAKYKLALNQDGNLTYQIPVNASSPYFNAYIVEPSCQFLFDTRQLEPAEPLKPITPDTRTEQIREIAKGFNNMVDGLVPTDPEDEKPATIKLIITSPKPEQLTPDQLKIVEEILRALESPVFAIEPLSGRAGSGKTRPRRALSTNNPNNDFNS